jgi:hypothetical protein
LTGCGVCMHESNSRTLVASPSRRCAPAVVVVRQGGREQTRRATDRDGRHGRPEKDNPRRGEKKGEKSPREPRPERAGRDVQPTAGPVDRLTHSRFLPHVKRHWLSDREAATLQALPCPARALPPSLLVHVCAAWLPLNGEAPSSPPRTAGVDAGQQWNRGERSIPGWPRAAIATVLRQGPFYVGLAGRAIQATRARRCSVFFFFFFFPFVPAT